MGVWWVGGRVMCVLIEHNTRVLVLLRLLFLPQSLRAKIQTAEEANECHVCMDAQINVTYYPCGHQFACR
jgi:hypothetical protein